MEQLQRMNDTGPKYEQFNNKDLVPAHPALFNAEAGGSGPKPYIAPDPVVLAFSEQSIRRAFARKVFAILGLLLLKTTAYIAICSYVPPVRAFWRANLVYTYIGIPIYVVACILLICVKSIRRTFPINYIMLLIFSTSITYTIGGICSALKTESVLTAFGMTTVLCLALIIFACQTKWDFTGCGMALCALLTVLIFSTILSLAFMDRAVHIWIAAAGIVLFSLFLIYDVQIIISGNHKEKISPEEHIYAVMILYLDIVNIFIRMLRVIR